MCTATMKGHIFWVTCRFYEKKFNSLKIIIFSHFHNHHNSFLLQLLSLARRINHVNRIFLLCLLENGISGM